MMFRTLTLLLIGLLTGAEALCFQEFPETAHARLRNYYKHSGREKTAIIFNQPEYFPGDTAYFSVFIFPESIQSSFRDVLNIVVLDKNGALLAHNRTLIKDNHGASQFVVAPGTAAGMHKLIAFMERTSSADTQPVYEAPFIISGKNGVSPNTGDTLAIFPEGGSPVINISSNLLVTGLVPGDSLFLRNQNGERVASSIASSSGFSVVSFKPRNNNLYFVLYKGKSFPVVGIKSSGAIITFEDTVEGGQLHINAYAPEPFEGNQYFIIRSRDRILELKEIDLRNSDGYTMALSSEKAHYPAGIYIASLVTESGMVLSERVFYLPGNPGSGISLQSREASYAIRSAASCETMLSGDSKDEIVHAAATVYKSDKFRTTLSTEINHFLQLADTHSPFFLLDTLPPTQLNALLVSARPRVGWETIFRLNPSIRPESYPAYFKGVVELDGKPAKDSTLITCWLKDHDFTYEVYTRQNGRFEFPLFQPFTDDEIVYTVSFKGEILSNALIVLDSLSIPDHRFAPSAPTIHENEYYYYASLRSAINKSYLYFEQKHRSTGEMEYIESIPTDFTIDVTKFKPYSTVIQLINEVIPLVRARKERDSFGLRVFMKETARHATGNPLIMIDGVLTDSAGYLISMNPSQIKSFGVVNSRSKLRPYGALGKDGILVIETIAGKPRALRSKKSLFVKGIDKPVSFKSGDDVLRNRGKRVPYLRPVLFWDSKVTPGRERSRRIEFFTGDDTGAYRIHVVGFTRDGTLIEASSFIEVVNE